jgi:hypothetical protein
MTRREEIEKAANEFYKGDEVSTFVVAAQWADKTMIDKACEILKNVTVTYNKRFFGKCEENAFDADFIKEFKQAMEE